MEYGIPPPAHRLPAGTHPGLVRLQISNLARSIEYYRSVLGLTLLNHTTESAALGNADGTSLVELRAGARASGGRRRLGLYHFAILLPNRPALGRFLAHVAALGVPVGSADHLVSEALYLSDPDGLGIEVYADRPRGAWRANGRELVMATDPLDLRSVVEAAQRTAWTGMPDGTVMGHVHLHVGDLARAEAFYHAALGLDKTVWSYPGALFLSAGGYHHHLGTNIWAAGAEPPRPDDAQLLEWELVVPASQDVEAAAASVAAAGYEIERRDGSALAADPWGTRVCLRL